ncbi:phosphotransferase system HPr (HPr) family protein [Thioflavicoccus mobilis 8321]|uniref:Phosphotransferase system HPr (HPr) family protein n=1 Tax=Thioflavicoccus mobilis 8321 TaxID=765912 RepID=L0H0A6_9GAMM|nr:HPr family phosphocarrier protein [Thioflavicoccus mobilis]AGA91477.1 phosphotransferase system HPr (HPr) family protein [Thioflavicoccus mobilis 8321]
MISKELKIINKLGLHARAAAKLVTCTSRFASQIQFTKDGRRVNGKSIMGVMMLAASQGSHINVEASGEDEEAAVAAIQALIGERFGEGE